MIYASYFSKITVTKQKKVRFISCSAEPIYFIPTLKRYILNPIWHMLPLFHKFLAEIGNSFVNSVATFFVCLFVFLKIVCTFKCLVHMNLIYKRFCYVIKWSKRKPYIMTSRIKQLVRRTHHCMSINMRVHPKWFHSSLIL